MLLLATLFFVAQTLDGHPTPSKTLHSTVQNVHSLLRRETTGIDFSLPNPETGLCDCPNMRSLRSIIWSCATTLIISAWVAVHFNVQPHSLSPFRRAMIRFATLSAAILGPEMALYWAYKEWTTSRKIDKWFKDKYRHWTRTHSFYLLMGGFAFCETNGDQTIWMAIHPRTFKEQLDKGLIEMPTITEEEIKDKSKGDGLAKAIAVIQLAWFSAQLIIRLAKGWAATELEVLTFATCIMTVGMYAFWWYKPQNIRCQTHVPLLQMEPPKVHEKAGSGISVIAANAPDDASHEEKDVAAATNTTDKPTLGSDPEKPSSVISIRGSGRLLENPAISPSRETLDLPHSVRSVFVSIGGGTNITTDDDTPFYELVFETPLVIRCIFLFFLPAYLLILMGSDGSDPGEWAQTPPPVGTADLDPDISTSFDQDDAVFLFLFFVFGGLHFITWSFEMPTVAERWLWRAASISLCAVPGIISLAILVLFKLKILDGKPLSNRTWYHVLIPTFGLFFTLHPAARLVLAIDSLVLLRDLPPTAYLSLSWSNVIPTF